MGPLTAFCGTSLFHDAGHRLALLSLGFVFAARRNGGLPRLVRLGPVDRPLDGWT